MSASRIWSTISAVLGALAWLPSRFVMPSAALDSSWNAVLQEAARRSWQFGTDIVFTYGPLGYLAVTTFAPDTFWRVVAFHMLVGSACGLALHAIVRNAGWPAWTGPIVLVALLPPIFGSSDIPFLLPVVLWPFLALQSERPWREPALLLLSAVVGAVALVKFTTLMLAVALGGVLAVNDFVKLRMPRAALIFLATIACLWMLAGQSVSGVTAWLRTSFDTSSAYSEAMSTPVGPYQRRELLLFAVNAVALLGLAVWRAARDAQPLRTSAALVASLGLIVFVQFKLGFVRHDAHATVAFFLMPVLGTLVATGATVPADHRRFRRMAAVVILIGMTSYAYGLRRYFDRLAPPEHYRAAYAFLLEGVGRYARPAQLHAELERSRREALATLRAVLPLPVGDGTIDLYGHQQGLLLAHDVTYAPRPIFQSYGAYTEPLGRLNRDYLEGERAPRRVLFDTEAIDHRYPLIDEAVSLPVLLTRYDVRDRVGDFTLLERRSDARTFRLTPLDERSTSVGEVMAIPAAAERVWAQIDVDLSAAGRLVAMAYKLPPLYLEVTTADGAVRQHRIIRPLAKAGMVLSPLVRSRDEFIGLANGDGPLDAQRVTSVKVVVDWAFAYAAPVHVRLFAMDVD